MFICLLLAFIISLAFRKFEKSKKKFFNFKLNEFSGIIIENMGL